MYKGVDMAAVFLVAMVSDSEIVERGFEPVLCGKAGVRKESVLAVPFRKAAMVEGLHVVESVHCMGP